MGPCDICGENPQAMQIGDMTTGEQKFVCVPCFARFGLDFAKAILPSEEIAAQLGPMFVAGVVAEEVHGPGQTAPKRGRKSKAKAETPQEQTGGPAEVAPAAENE